MIPISSPTLDICLYICSSDVFWRILWSVPNVESATSLLGILCPFFWVALGFNASPTCRNRYLRSCCTSEKTVTFTTVVPVQVLTRSRASVAFLCGLIQGT